MNETPRDFQKLSKKVIDKKNRVFLHEKQPNFTALDVIEMVSQVMYAFTHHNFNFWHFIHVVD